MKHYFKYGSGYVNIDDENLYLTNSGNWQEARELKEKSTATITENEIRIGKMKGFVYKVFGVIAIFIYYMVENKTISISIFIGLGVLAYHVLQYFKSDFGKRYKIPLVKIETVEKYNKGLKIIFRNENNEPDFEIIDNVEVKGFQILTNLNIISEFRHY